jgi:hypothetical protein
MENYNEQAMMLVERLKTIREGYLKTQKELALSQRRDVTATELKEILTENVDYYGLRNALDEYIKKLLDIGETKNE